MNQPWSQIGPHRYRRIGNLFEWSPQGVIELVHARALISQLDALQQECGVAALITDSSQLMPLSPEVRSYYVHASQHSLSGILIVIFGAGLLTKATQLLMFRAGKALYKVQAEMHHASTREEALTRMNELLEARKSQTIPAR